MSSIDKVFMLVRRFVDRYTLSVWAPELYSCCAPCSSVVSVRLTVQTLVVRRVPFGSSTVTKHRIGLSGTGADRAAPSTSVGTADSSMRVECQRHRTGRPSSGHHRLPSVVDTYRPSRFPSSCPVVSPERRLQCAAPPTEGTTFAPPSHSRPPSCKPIDHLAERRQRKRFSYRFRPSVRR
ncbi:unnamed protein product [Soboliphyme baturini]|uniref:Uncharacterized protein n=1 Tax=Soboliphyme baturini TaxID=241478 RepID=A0A183J209_9BILA|nr:unnamed protein product [Soboliphyme baturini]